MSTAPPPNGTEPKEAYSFEALTGGVARLKMNARMMHLEEARPLCGDIEEASAGDPISLVVDMGGMGLATPAAAFHGLRTLRHVRIAGIALVHANPAMRRMTAMMLRAARFPRFGFFDDEDAAVAWLQREPEATPQAAPVPSGRRRAAAAAAAALAGGLAARAAARRLSGRSPAPRRGPPRTTRLPRARVPPRRRTRR